MQPNRTTAYLLVSRAPSITRHASLLRAAGPLGGRARLRCRAHAVPDATFHWSIQSDSGPIRYNNTKYSFYEVQLDHSTFEVDPSFIFGVIFSLVFQFVFCKLHPFLQRSSREEAEERNYDASVENALAYDEKAEFVSMNWSAQYFSFALEMSSE